jgi:hypothetical protein
LKLELIEGHYVLRLSRQEAEDVYTATLVEMIKNSELEPLHHWAREGVEGARELCSEDLAWRIWQYTHFVGPPELVAQFESFKIDEEYIEGVIVAAPDDLETIAKIEAHEAAVRVYNETMKKGL